MIFLFNFSDLLCMYTTAIKSYPIWCQVKTVVWSLERDILRTNYETIFQAFLRTIAIYVRTCGKDRVYDRLSFWSLHVRTYLRNTHLQMWQFMRHPVTHIIISPTMTSSLSFVKNYSKWKLFCDTVLWRVWQITKTVV